MLGEKDHQAENTPNDQGTSPAIRASAERHYSVSEIAERWSLSEDAVRRLFCNEPGVLALGDSSVGRRKRRYVTLRIPQSVLDRVHLILSL